MKKLVKITLALLLALTLCIVTVVHFVADTIYISGDFSYTKVFDDYAAVCGWESDSSELAVPERIDNVPVREISNWCFNGRTDITSVDFYYAAYLEKIGISAFKGCTGITGILDIPAQVRNMGANAFQNCSSLETVYYNAGSTVIPAQCFYNCASLKTVYIGDGLERIERHAFADCDSLKLVRIPESVTEIHAYAFNQSSNVVIYCYTDSYAHRFAQDNHIEYVLIDAPIPTEPETEAPTEEPATEPVTEAPTAEPTLPTEMSGYYLGDVDGNGLVETIDATYIQRSVAHMPYPVADEMMLHGDVDGDGRVSIIDATYIQRYIAHTNTPYPVGEIINN